MIFLFKRTQEDLVTLIEAHMQLSKFCSDTSEALEYIAGMYCIACLATLRIDTDL